jgi:hypothetical protein
LDALPRDHTTAPSVRTPLTWYSKFALLEPSKACGDAMITFLLGPAIGLGFGVTLAISIAEGVVLTTVIAALSERFFFPMPQD